MSKKPQKPRFGPCEQKLFDYLQGAFRSPMWERDRLEVLAHVYDVHDPAEAAAGGYFNRLRQLQHAVNRKLRKAGHHLKIISQHNKFLSLIVTTISNRPERPGREENATTPRSPARRRGLSVRECASLLEEELAKGNNRSSALERLCIKERGGSRRAYFAARRRLGLRSVFRSEGGRSYWVLVRPKESPESPSHPAPPG